MKFLFTHTLLTSFFQTRNDDAATAAAAGVGIGMILLYLAIFALVIVGMYKIFEKAGKPGWAAIVPIYNLIVLLEIVGKPLWWILLCIIPCVNIVALVIINIELAKRFGKDTVYGILLALFGVVMYPVLGFSDAQYTPPSDLPTTT
jgi:hypothetical protein